MSSRPRCVRSKAERRAIGGACALCAVVSFAGRTADVYPYGMAFGRAWSEAARIDAVNHDEVAINPIIDAEIVLGFATTADLDAHLAGDAFRRLPLPDEAGFVRGRALVEYRRRGGVRTSPLLAFTIGNHAAAGGLKLLTPDANRYRGYFPKVGLNSLD